MYICYELQCSPVNCSFNGVKCLNAWTNITLSFREDFKKKNCIFYDIWQKGRGSKDQNQISEKNLNLDKVLGGVGKRLQCHKNSYLKNLVFYCLFCQKISIFYTPSQVYDISIITTVYVYDIYYYYNCCYIGKVRNLV